MGGRVDADRYADKDRQDHTDRHQAQRVREFADDLAPDRALGEIGLADVAAEDAGDVFHIADEEILVQAHLLPGDGNVLLRGEVAEQLSGGVAGRELQKQHDDQRDAEHRGDDPQQTLQKVFQHCLQTKDLPAWCFSF